MKVRDKRKRQNEEELAPKSAVKKAKSSQAPPLEFHGIVSITAVHMIVCWLFFFQYIQNVSKTGKLWFLNRVLLYKILVYYLSRLCAKIQEKLLFMLEISSDSDLVKKMLTLVQKVAIPLITIDEQSEDIVLYRRRSPPFHVTQTGHRAKVFHTPLIFSKTSVSADISTHNKLSNGANPTVGLASAAETV